MLNLLKYYYFYFSNYNIVEKIIRFIFIFCSCCLFNNISRAQSFTRQDTLRGTITPERAWWDVMRYDIQVTPDFDSKTIIGIVDITVKITGQNNTMQIDLQAPLEIDSIFLVQQKQKISYIKDGNAWFLKMPSLAVNSTQKIKIFYHGKPREAIRPPWDGGWIWKKDEQGNPWMSVACQGLGASVWYPCKDHQSDEPDQGASISMTVPGDLVAVANGRKTSEVKRNDGKVTYTWSIVNPINNYNIIPYIGKYVNWTETFNGEKGKLGL
jgi:aminopeptidase N